MNRVETTSTSAVDHRAPLLLDLPIGREQQQGNLDDAAELTGAGGLQIKHRKALGTGRQQLRQRQWLLEESHGCDGALPGIPGFRP